MNVVKIIQTVGNDIWGGVKKLFFIFAVVACAVSVLMSVLSFFGSTFPGVYMPAVYTVGGLGLAFFFGYVLREVAKECTWKFSLNVGHFLVVLITFAFFFLMATMCVGATTVLDIWIRQDLTLGQVWEQRSLFENFSMYMSFLMFGLAVASVPAAYCIGVYERIKKDE